MISSYVALDIETTGLNPAEDKIIEIGMAMVCNGQITDSRNILINPQIKLPDRIVELTGITDDMLSGKPYIAEVIGEVVDFIGELPILGHNIVFDYSFIKKAAVNAGYGFEHKGIDTLKLARRLLPEVPSKRLDYLCGFFQIDAGSSHRAYDDAVSASRLFHRLYEIKPDDSGFDELIELKFNAKKDSPITAAQKRYLNALCEKHSVVMEQDVDTLTKSKASKLIDGIISSYGKL